MTTPVRIRMGAAALLAAFTGQAWADEPAVQGSDPGPTHTTLSRTELDAAGIISLPGVAQVHPGLTTTPSWNSLTAPLLFIRGAGLEDSSGITRDGAVGIYQDGFPIARAQALGFDLLELDQVQLLEGPSALYARNTPGGVINLVSDSPAGYLRLAERAEFGNRNAFRVLSSLDTPAWHGLSAKVTLLASSIDGYTKNTGAPPELSQPFGLETDKGARLKLHWRGLAHLGADYFIERSELGSTPAYDSNPALNGESFGVQILFPYYASTSGPMGTAYRAVLLPRSPSGQTAQGLTLSWQPAQALAVRSLTGYRTLDATQTQDYTESFGYSEGTIDTYRHHQLSQQLEASGNLLDRQIHYLLGGSYFRERGHHESLFGLPQNNPSEVDRRIVADAASEAGYAQLGFQPAFLGRHIELSLAARYQHDTRDAERFLSDSAPCPGSAAAGPCALENGVATGAVDHLRYDRVSPQASLTYHIVAALDLYAQGSRSDQGGGALESAAPGQFGKSRFEPDRRTTYEMGLRSHFLGERLRVNTSVFDTRYEKLQYAIPYGIVVQEIETLQKAQVRGGDLDLQVVPAGEDLAVTLRGQYLSWHIDRALVQSGSILDPASGRGSPYTVGQNVADLFAFPYTPKYRLTAASDYTVLHLDRREVRVHLNYSYQGKMFSTAAAGPALPGNQLDTLPAVGLLDARLSLTQETDFSHRVRISLWGQNVLNRKYYLLSGGVGPDGIGSGLAPTNGSPQILPAGYSSRAVAWAPPPTYGVSFAYDY
jgi:iron complex outermembrane receptor protein